MCAIEKVVCGMGGGVFYIGDREGRGGVFRRLCVGMILGWDFYWFGVGRGFDVFLWGRREF